MYDAEYFNQTYGYLKDDDSYLIRAKIAFKKYFADIPHLEKKNILEVGAGLGKNIFHLGNAYAYDTSKFANEFCQNKGIKTVETIKKNTYDLIASIHSLEHMKEPLAFLQDIHSRLKEGGTLLLVLPFEEHKYVDHFQPDSNNHLYSWNFRSINNLLQLAGFKIMKNEFIFEGIGYKKLKRLYRFSPIGMYLVTSLITTMFFRKQRELKIIASKDGS